MTSVNSFASGRAGGTARLEVWSGGSGLASEEELQVGGHTSMNYTALGKWSQDGPCFA